MEQPRSARTEKPTTRRLQKSREQGQVPRSQELPPALVLAGVLIFLRTFGGSFLGSMEDFLVRSLGSACSMGLEPSGMIGALRASLVSGLGLGLPLLGCVALGSAVGQFAQGGFVLSADGLKPNAGRLNPVANLKSLVSLKRIVLTLRTVLKLTLVTWVVYATVAPEMPAVLAQAGRGPREIFVFTCLLVGRILFKFLLLALLIALADYLYQKYEHVRGLKMTKQEIREERRDLEGDPLVRSRQRARQMALARRRMMAEIPRADVVVVNPTHCAVALRYEKSRGGAPRVVAKGVDRIAARIRTVAEEHKIPIYEDAPLAWALYKAVELGREIPADLYKAVAEVLAHIFRLRKSGRRAVVSSARARARMSRTHDEGRQAHAGRMEDSRPIDARSSPRVVDEAPEGFTGDPLEASRSAASVDSRSAWDETSDAADITRESDVTGREADGMAQDTRASGLTDLGVDPADREPGA